MIIENFYLSEAKVKQSATVISHGSLIKYTNMHQSSQNRFSFLWLINCQINHVWVFQRAVGLFGDEQLCVLVSSNTTHFCTMFCVPGICSFWRSKMTLAEVFWAYVSSLAGSHWLCFVRFGNMATMEAANAGILWLFRFYLCLSCECAVSRQLCGALWSHYRSGKDSLPGVDSSWG